MGIPPASEGKATTDQSGIANCGPLFLTFPTILSTGQIFNASYEIGLKGIFTLIDPSMIAVTA